MAMRCPRCGESDITLYFTPSVAFEATERGLGSPLTEISDVIEQCRNKEPEAAHCNDCEYEWIDPGTPNEPRQTHCFDAIDLKPFRYLDEDEIPPNVVPLFDIDDDSNFEDANGNLFERIGPGPAQGSIEVADHKQVHAYWDGSIRVLRKEK